VLDILDRHKAGILGTIVIHLLFATIILVMKINSIKEHESAVMLDLLSEEQVKELMQPEESKQKQPVQTTEEFLKKTEQEYLGAKNIGTNEADKVASDKIDQMVSELKNELNVNDQPAANWNAKPQETPKEESTSENLTKEESTDVSKNVTGVRTFYKGPTTVSYFLEGRYHQYLPIPVYKCQGHGKVVMKIEVNQQGFVVNLDVNKAQSEIPDECILETAINAARSTRFNVKKDAPPKQQGTLTYVFIAQ
jgi:hypothetical protein